MRLYIHIPFCTSKCGYCAFNSFAMGEGQIQESAITPYVEALCLDLEWNLRMLKECANANMYLDRGRLRIEPDGKALKIDSIFFGGGTPNLLHARYYEKIFETLRKHIGLSEDCEITLEANVNLIEEQWCRDLLSLGANRLSVGVQSFCDTKLTFLEREHNAFEIAKRIESAYRAGFENLSCDLIIGTPLDSQRLLDSEIAQATALPLSHISMYALSIDEGSRFAFDAKKGDSKLGKDEEDLSFYARDLLNSKGFLQYEVSNYTKTPHAKCDHNLGYWRGEEYIGCGAGAVGRVGSVRSKGLPNLNEYIKSPTKRLSENLSQNDLLTESIMLGLRCEEGFNLELLGMDWRRDAHLDSIITLLVDEGKCSIHTRHGGVNPSTHKQQSKGQMSQSFLVANELFLSDEIALYILSRN